MWRRGNVEHLRMMMLIWVVILAVMTIVWKTRNGGDGDRGGRVCVVVDDNESLFVQLQIWIGCGEVPSYCDAFRVVLFVWNSEKLVSWAIWTWTFYHGGVGLHDDEHTKDWPIHYSCLLVVVVAVAAFRTLRTAPASSALRQWWEPLVWDRPKGWVRSRWLLHHHPAALWRNPTEYEWRVVHQNRSFFGLLVESLWLSYPELEWTCSRIVGARCDQSIDSRV